MFTLEEFLRQEIKPALGCTEPGSVALAVARACEEIPNRNDVSLVKVTVSDSIYKNGAVVSIPGVKGARGNIVAAALAVVCGCANLGLEALKKCAPDDVAVALRWVEEGRIQIAHDPDKDGIYVEVTIITPSDTVTCVIAEEHTNVVKVMKNGVSLFEKPVDKRSFDTDTVVSQMAKLSYPDLFVLIDKIDPVDEAYLMEGARMNKKAAAVGLERKNKVPPGFGQALQDLIKEGVVSSDLGYRIRSYCYAACDARMRGGKLPVMSSAGSGNHGITAILPVALLGEALGKTKYKIARGLFLSHLTTSFIKSKLGRLSPICGCAVAAGAGAAAGMTLLLGGSKIDAEQAALILFANTAGMFCDGAKETCALKVGAAAHEAYMAALFAMHGIRIKHTQGVAGTTLDRTIENVARVTHEGMKSVDRIIIKIVEDNRL